MGCGSCSKDGLPKGCRSNGSCGVSGCEKLTVFDWLSDMSLPSNVKKFDIAEVRFKNGRKEYMRNVNDLSLAMGDVVAVEGNPGHDVGVISLMGELVRVQLKNKEVNTQEIKKIYRKANQRDIDIWKEAQGREFETMHEARKMASKLGLKMKISDVEFQGDNAKATFFYTADSRVDFRELIKVMAGQFKIRIEMRQIGARQEAGRLGGIGSCGRELCCSTWLTDFRTVNTSAARYQQLALNPQKLAGQCGKLKCCLNYELDSYLDALKAFPDTNVKLKTKKGEASFQKMDIFKNLIWYSYDENFGSDWIALPVKKAHQILKDNHKGVVPESLEIFAANTNEVVAPQYDDVVGQDDLKRFDNKKPNNRRRKKTNKGPQNKQKQGAQQKNPDAKPQQQGNQKKSNNPQNQGPQKKRRPTNKRRGGKPNNNPNKGKSQND